RTASTTFPGSFSPTVKVNGKHAHRCGDMQWMVIPDKGGLGTSAIGALVSDAMGDMLGVDLSAMTTIGNTFGTIVEKLSPPTPTINADGKIDPPTPDTSDLWSAVGNAVIDAGIGMIGSEIGGVAGSVASAVLGGIANTAPASQSPAAASGSGNLGCFFGSPVVLRSAQSFHTFGFLPLEGLLPLSLELTYVNRANLKGMFGFDRACNYEKRFVKYQENSYKLSLSDGRWFAFSYQPQTDSFKDHGGLGVDIEMLDEKSVRLRYHDGIIETYTYGLLVKIEDIRYPDNAIMLSYLKHPKAGPRIDTIRNTQDALFRFGYNRQGLVEKIEDHVEGLWECSYDVKGYLLEIYFNGTLQEQYDYMNIEATLEDEHYLRTVYNSFKEPQLTFSYHDNGTLSGYEEKEASYRYVWHKNGDIVKTDQDHRRHLFRLNRHGEIEKIIYPDMALTEQRYDALKRTLHTVTRGGHHKITQYDERGRILSVMLGGEIVETFGYEGNNPSAVMHTNKAGETTTTTYDAQWHKLSVTHADGATQHFAYTPQGNLAQYTDAMGAVTTYSYDEKQRILSVRNALGLETVYAYNAYGQRISQTNPRGEVLHFGYEHFGYDRHSRLIAYTNDMSETLHFGYTPTGKLAHITDPSAKKTTFGYDVYDRIVSTRYPHHAQEQYRYHDDGTLSSIQRVDGTWLYFSYDTNQNLTQIKAIQEATEGCKAKEEVWKYSYDGLGNNLVKAHTQEHTLRFFYDAHANIRKVEQGKYTLLRQFDAMQRLQWIQFLGHSQYFFYDKASKLCEVKNHANPLKSGITLAYNPNRVLIQKSFPNHTQETYSYNEASQLISITYSTAKENEEQEQIHYQRDKLGRIQRIDHSKEQSPLEYTYNQRGELIEVDDGTTSQHFEYHASGNLEEEASQYNTANQLLENATYLYTYDARGNLHTKTHKVTKATTVYTFNLFDQLMEVRAYEANLQQVLLEQWEYRYDALNQRVGKRYTSYQEPHKSYTHYYLYHNEAIVAIIDEEQTLLATLTHADTIDTPLSITNELTGQTYYYHTDHQGSITHLSNENGEIVESFTYDNSYGTITSHEQTEETYNPYCYTAREYENHDLYYYRARYYDPTIGRFISKDPIEFLSNDFNWYRYVSNNPVNRTDPSGLIVASEDNHTTMPSEVPKFELFPGEEIFNEPGLIDISDIFIPMGRIFSGIAKGIEGVSKGGGFVVVEGGATKPYSKHRPSYKKGQVEDTWKNAKDRNGKVTDPNTGEELTWDKSKPRNGQWDMGHVPTKEYRKLHKKYMNGDISKEKFLKEYQDPNNYRPELVKTNRGRKHEAK
ncbi:MAG: hypothetical protein DSZ09_00775, partial [Sulfurovum sp.]